MVHAICIKPLTFLVENSENYRGIYVRGDSEGRLLVCVCMRKMSFNGPLFATIRTFQDVGMEVALRQP